MASSVAEFCETVLRSLWRHWPVNATFLGIHDYDGRLGSFHPGALAEKRADLARHLRELERLRATSDPFSPDERLDLQLLAGELRTALRIEEELRLPHRNPGSYLEDATYGVYLLMMRDFAPAEERARSAVSRLNAVPAMLDEARENLSRPEEVPPLWAEMSADLTASAAEFFTQSIPWSRELSPGLHSDFRRASESARRAVEGYERFLAEKIRPAARGDYAVGREMFDFMLREAHGLSDDAASLEAFGREEVRRTLALLQKEAARAPGGSSWQEQVEICKREVPEPGSLLTLYRDEIVRARRFLMEQSLFTFPPGETLQVVETPVFERKTTPFAAYVPPAPFEPKQEGYFWVTPADPGLPPAERALRMQGHVVPGIPITAVHEGYPGHHLQISLANRAATKVRRQIWTPVMVEGWALYCEELMGERGFYLDPRTRLLQLKDYLWRSCRVVIDVGLHTGTFSDQEAVRLLVETAKLDPAGAAGEVKRYTKTPTQPLSYAVGKREILKLREDLSKVEGAAFSLRGFHDRLLQFGSIPIAHIRSRILPAHA
ncbi:MAG TPA: DUF885 domain-containing protein [Candidatus Polarisedimenticolia bacterium]|jgi:uncharacterized protein (DUF885 family)|nr:DUF885 domain-containing protein [Candidatus Polarisedimenticolia bacterium]